MPTWFEEANTLSETIQIYGTIISFVIALATASQVFVAYTIAQAVRKAAKVTEAMSISHRINDQWQEFNKLVITDPVFRDTNSELEGRDEPENITRMRYMIFIILNVMHDSYFAIKTKNDPFRVAEANIRDHLELLKVQKHLVIGILDGNRGYDQEFVKICKSIIEQDD